MKIKKKRIINKQKVFCFISFIFLLVCILWYGGRAIYFYLYSKKTIENQDNILSQEIINQNDNKNTFKKINNNYYFYKDASNNYLTYSNLVWRIIKINEDNQITLILDNPITNLAFGEKKKYTNSYPIKWLNNSNNYTGILENNLNNPNNYLMKSPTCIDNITNIKKVTCKKTNDDNYLSLLSLVDYINTGAENSFINTNQNTYLANTNKNNIWYIDESGKLDTTDGTDIYGIKPTITLKPTTKLISGNGTEDSPYIIEDKTTLFASYVKLDEDIWRIYEVNDNYIKLVLNDYLKINNENLEHTYSNNNYYHNDTIYGSLAYYLNHNYLNKLSYKNLIIENKYPNSYYGQDNNYDYSSVINTTIDTKVSIPSIGEPILNNKLDNYFINTGESKNGSLIYIVNNTSTLSTTKVTKEANVIPCITIKKDNLKLGTGSLNDPYRTE